MLQSSYSEPQKYSKDVALHKATSMHIELANIEDL